MNLDYVAPPAQQQRRCLVLLVAEALTLDAVLKRLVRRRGLLRGSLRRVRRVLLLRRRGRLVGFCPLRLLVRSREAPPYVDRLS
jgi:hypothetical protein